jgi:hypothetical protein
MMKMAKKVLKTRTQFTSTLKNSLHKDLRELSTESSVPISRLLDVAVRKLLEKKDDVGL